MRPALQSTRLLSQLRESLRYRHYSLSTEENYVYWVKFFVRWSGRSGAGMRHPKVMGVTEVKEVLGMELPWMKNIQRPQQPKRIPSVLTQAEVAALLAQLGGTESLLARLLYGTGMRLVEGLGLCIKDVDFDRKALSQISLGGVGRLRRCSRLLFGHFRPNFRVHSPAMDAKIGAKLPRKLVCDLPGSS